MFFSLKILKKFALILIRESMSDVATSGKKNSMKNDDEDFFEKRNDDEEKKRFDE